jgi:hypothetical protein
VIVQSVAKCLQYTATLKGQFKVFDCCYESISFLLLVKKMCLFVFAPTNQNTTTVKTVLTTNSEQQPSVYNGQLEPQFSKKI